ncbi:protein LNK1-like [Ananas comosus]|uniref:Protein LNK1-like n=1 Tax=Ananas comosus TaxID=4615 RepID=A0A6P5F6D8_ANACO|nr:protein LNK1-like [Ananas comosus]XP_020091172.1 protein LNK1-like [Ananas comosus]
MPDWKDCELEDNIWDEFARNGNSTVPYQCGEQLNESQAKIDTNNKSQNEVNVETSTANITSETKDGNTFSFKDGSNNCAFSISDASPSGSNLNLPDTENDLLYYDWPAIDNFEDVDRMFRNCDSTYGQHQTDNTDGLSWFPPSSNIVYGPEVALQPGLSSSCSELDLLNDSDSNLLSKIAPVAASANYQFNVDWVDAVAEDNGKCVLKEQCIQAYEGGEVEQSTFSQIQNTSSSSGCENLDRIGSQYSSTENKMQQLVNQKLSAASACKPHAAQNVSKQKQPLDNASSSYMDSMSPYSEFDYSFPLLEVPFPQIASIGGFKECEANPSFSKAVCYVTSDEANPCTKFSRKEASKLQNRHLMHETVMGDHPNQEASTVKGFLGGKPHKSQCDIDRGEHEKRRTEVSQVGIDPLHLLDSSIVTSISADDISLEETSLKQLQDVMNQLDVKTKLCLRDGLYRLARSAKQRNYFSSPSDCNGESGDTRRAQNTEASDKSVDISVAETETNPIDRSIAHLLFHCPSGPRTRTVEDATSLESHITNEQSQVPTNNQDAVPNPVFSRKQFGSSRNA